MSPGLLLSIQIALICGALCSLAWFWAEARQRRLALLPLAILLLSLALILIVSGWRNRARSTVECAARLQALGLAMELYALNNEGTPAASLEYLVPFYFEEIPVCPLEGGEAPRLEQADSRFTLVCRGRHAGLGGTPEGFPRYTMRSGAQVRP